MAVEQFGWRSPGILAPPPSLTPAQGPKQRPAGPFSPRRVPAGCGTGHVDLVMVIDGSKSVRPQNFELVKQFVNRIVDLLEVSPQGTRVGLVQYSSRVRTEFPLNKYHSADEIKAAVMKVEYMEKGTMTGLALKHMVEHSFSELEGARPLSHNVPRIGLVFTDGRSQDDISEWARRAKESGERGKGLGTIPGWFLGMAGSHEWGLACPQHPALCFISHIPAMLSLQCQDALNSTINAAACTVLTLPCPCPFLPVLPKSMPRMGEAPGWGSTQLYSLWVWESPAVGRSGSGLTLQASSCSPWVSARRWKRSCGPSPPSRWSSTSPTRRTSPP